jgi:hypothetical protein
MLAVLALVTLHYGVFEDGTANVDVEIGPLSVSDWFALAPARDQLAAAQKDPTNPASAGASYTFACEALARRIRRFGALPRHAITPAFLRERLMVADLELLITHAARLDDRLERFRLELEAAPQAGDGPRPADALVPS